MINLLYPVIYQKNITNDSSSRRVNNVCNMRMLTKDTVCFSGNSELSEIESVIRNNSYETAVVIDKNGNEISRKQEIADNGDRHEIEYSNEEIEPFEGCTFTHNHPDSSSFSLQDVVMARIAKLDEIRVVGDKYTYSMKFSPDFFKKDINEIVMTSQLCYQQIKSDFSENDKMGVLHALWQETAPLCGFTYKREPVRD